jgi:5-methyltetrahydrofolate--homocysteine methyltransferase
LNAEKNCGIKLTESFAMDPAASVCGYYFADEKAKYFNVGEISEEQFEEYAKRKGMGKNELRRVFAGKIK